MIKLFVGISEGLYADLQNFLNTHPRWNQDSVVEAALALYLLQQGDRKSSSKY